MARSVRRHHLMAVKLCNRWRLLRCGKLDSRDANLTATLLEGQVSETERPVHASLYPPPNSDAEIVIVITVIRGGRHRFRCASGAGFGVCFVQVDGSQASFVQLMCRMRTCRLVAPRLEVVG